MNYKTEFQFTSQFYKLGQYGVKTECNGERRRQKKPLKKHRTAEDMYIQKNTEKCKEKTTQ